MGTGMIASSSTLRIHIGRVIRNLSRLLHAALVYSDYLREAAASICLAIILGPEDIRAVLKGHRVSILNYSPKHKSQIIWAWLGLNHIYMP